jgi:hypothetical protein
MYSFGTELYSFPEDYTMLKYILTATLLAILSLTPISFAQTADGYTPAVEEDCDNLNGALYGLCVAYCEAMDCDSDFPNADQSACDHVFGNYMDKAAALGADEIPPCDNPVNIYEDYDSDDTDDVG